MKRKLISSICALTMLFTGASGMAGTMANAEGSDKYVLSDNAFTDADKTLYANSGIALNKLDTGADYAWSSDSNAELRQYDGYGKARNSTLPFYGDEMTGGNIESDAQYALTWTSWGSGAYSTAQFDLKDVYNVSGVDVWGLVQDNGTYIWQIGDIQIFAGETKENMSLVWQGDAESISAEEYASGVKKKVVNTPAVFDAVNARYVYVKFAKAASVTFGEKSIPVYQARISEIVIFGTSSKSETKMRIDKTIRKAEEYLAGKAYYTDGSVAALESAVNELKVLDDSSEALLVNVAIEDAEAAISNLVPVDTHYTLSGNEWVERDTEIFYSVWEPGFELIKLDNSAGYTYLTGGEPQAADADFNKLNGGDIYKGESTVWTAWDTGAPIAVKFDLGGKYAVDRVDVIQDIQGSNNSMKYAEVYVSEDGENFVKAGEAAGNNDNKIAGDHTNPSFLHDHAMTSVQFPIKRARYVAVVASRQGHQLRLADIAVFGYKSSLGEIDNKIAEVQPYFDAAEYYTIESVQALQAAVNEASAMTEDNSKSEIDACIEKIDNAFKALEPANQRLILSGNSWIKPDDQTAYEKYDPSIKLVNASNKPSYVWTADSSVQCVKEDAEFTKLNGGNITNFAATCGTSTKWDDGTPGISVWDLGMTGVIDRVDVFSGHETYKQLGTVTVSVSNDGENFTEIKTVKASGEYSTEQVMNMTSVKFVPVKARYVKIVCTKAGSPAHMTNINEVVIFGIGADFSGLEAAVAEYDEASLNTLKEFAAEESYNALIAAIDSGKAMIASQSGTKAEIDAAIADIQAKFEGIVYKETEGVFTNNLTAESDKALYPGLDNLNIGMTYRITSTDANSADGGILGNDSDFVKLTKGNIAATPGSECVYGKWSGDTNVSIILDAAEEVYFTGADLYEWANKTDGRGVGKIKISVSSDGENYTDIKSIASDYQIGDDGLFQHENGQIVINRLGSSLVPVKGRYIKIDAERRGYQMILAEVVVKGFRVPHVIEHALTFGKTEYVIMDTDAGDLQDLAGANFIYASGELINESEQDVACNVITAVYDAEQRLIAIAVGEDITVSAGVHNTWENTLDGLGGLPAGSQLKNFAWSTSMSMKPEALVLVK